MVCQDGTLLGLFTGKKFYQLSMDPEKGDHEEKKCIQCIKAFAKLYFQFTFNVMFIWS